MEHCRNFAGLRKFRNLQNFTGCEILQLAKSFSCCHYSSSYHCSLSYAFLLFDSFVTFWFASHFTLYVIVIVHVIWYFCLSWWLYKPFVHTVKRDFLSSEYIFGAHGQFCLLLLFAPLFFHFLSFFSDTKHPLRMTTQGMVG